MGNLIEEELVALKDVPSLLPRRQDKPISYTTVYRWTRYGLSGTVLESIRIGGSKFTSVEAISRFIRALSACPNECTRPQVDTAAAIRAGEKLKEMGIY